MLTGLELWLEYPSHNFESHFQNLKMAVTSSKIWLQYKSCYRSYWYIQILKPYALDNLWLAMSSHLHMAVYGILSKNVESYFSKLSFCCYSYKLLTKWYNIKPTYGVLKHSMSYSSIYLDLDLLEWFRRNDGCRYHYFLHWYQIGGLRTFLSR